MIGKRSSHRLRDDASDHLGGPDKIDIGEMGVSCGRSVASVPEQLAQQGQILARHNRVTRCRMPQVTAAAMAHGWDETVFQVDALRELFGYNRSVGRSDED